MLYQVSISQKCFHRNYSCNCELKIERDNTGSKSLSESNNEALLMEEGVRIQAIDNPESKVHEANMGPIWGHMNPGGPHVGPMNFAIWDSV